MCQRQASRCIKPVSNFTPMPSTIHVNAKLTPRQRKALHQDTGLSIKQSAEKYGVTTDTVYKWRRRTDFEDRSSAPKKTNEVLSPFEQILICEVRKSTRFSVAGLIDVLSPYIAHIGRGNVSRLLTRERLNRKEYLLVEGQKTKPKRFKSYEPGFLHVDIKYLPKINKIRHYLFVAIDRNTRLVTIGIYPKSGIKEAVVFLRHCVDYFEFTINTVLTDNGPSFTDRFRHGRGRPSGKHLFDMACKQHSIEHRLTRAYHPQTNGMVERFNRRVSDVLKSVHFENQRVLTETMHGYVNHYNRKQTQVALGGLAPLDYWNQVKRTGDKWQGGDREAREPADLGGACVMSGNAAPDPTILKRKTREAQEHTITSCHPQLNQEYSDNDPCYYKKQCTAHYMRTMPKEWPKINFILTRQGLRLMVGVVR